MVYLSKPPLDDLPNPKANWQYRVISPAKFWTQWRLPLDLYAHNPRPDIFLSLGHYAPRFTPIKNIVTITDLGFLTYPEQLTRKDLWQLKHWTDYSVRSAGHIIAISEYTKKDIIKFYHINPNKISIIYPGYDKDLFRPLNNQKEIEKILLKYNITKPYLLFIGALKPNKNLERLITAFSRLEYKNFNLVIVGKKGWFYESIFETVSKLKLEDRIIFTGFVPDIELPFLLNAARLFVFPSLYEGFGMPVIEAMACGTPVVTSNVASLPEVIGDAGVTVDPYRVEDITAGIIDGLEKHIFYSEKGLKRVKSFSWDQSAKQLIKIIERFL